MGSSSIERSRAVLASSLRERREEIEAAGLIRIYAVANTGDADPTYTDGLRKAVTAALDYALAGVAAAEDRPPPLPTALLAQARLAARNAIDLDTVLRRYLAGYSLFGDFVLDEAQNIGLDAGQLKRLLASHASLFERLVAAIGEEYARERRGRVESSEQRRAELVERLLAAELIDASELRYEFDGVHLALMAAGPVPDPAIRSLARSLDRRCLIVRREDLTWSWLGGRRPLAQGDLERALQVSWPEHLSVAIGEQAQGLDGWRLSHRQARAALPIALRDPRRIVRYADVALLAALLQDPLLATSLFQLYLMPLSNERDGGEALRHTLRAYFAAERNATAAAASLRVSRQTVINRIRVAEERIGRPLNECAAELEAVLELMRLGFVLSGCGVSREHSRINQAGFPARMELS